jgi:hypothetical protein
MGGGANIRVNKFHPTQIDFGLKFVKNQMERCFFVFMFFRSWSFFNIIIINDENDKQIAIPSSCNNLRLISL